MEQKKTSLYFHFQAHFFFFDSLFLCLNTIFFFFFSIYLFIFICEMCWRWLVAMSMHQRKRQNQRKMNVFYVHWKIIYLFISIYCRFFSCLAWCIFFSLVRVFCVSFSLNNVDYIVFHLQSVFFFCMCCCLYCFGCNRRTNVAVECIKNIQQSYSIETTRSPNI